MAYFEFPHTRTYDSDLGWLIKNFKLTSDQVETLEKWAAEHKTEYKELNDKVEGLINNLVDVISPWDSSIAYHIYSIVEWQGTNYIAIRDVPVGAMITNTEYWQPANTTIEQINAIGVTVDQIKNETVRRFRTLSELIAENDIESGAIAYTAGYYAVNDNGGAFYLISDTEPTGYYETMDNGLYAAIIPDKIMAPEQFGAMGDDSADDFNALQSCINTAGCMQLTRGKTYRMSEGLTLPTDSEIDMNGAIIKMFNIVDVYTSSFKNFLPTDTEITGTDGRSNIIVKNGTIYGAQFLFMHGENILLDNMTLYDSWGHTLQIAGCQNVRVIKCRFLGSIENGDEAVNFDTCVYSAFPFLPDGSAAFDETGNTDILVEDCYIAPEGTIEARRFMAGGIGDHNLTGAGKHTRCIIRNNFIYTTKTHGIGAFGFYDSEISGNEIVVTAGLPIEYGASLNLVIADNRLGGHSFTPEAGIKVTKAATYSSSIWGNTFVDSNPSKMYVANYTNTFKTLQRVRLIKGMGNWDVTLSDNVRITDINKLWVSLHDLATGTYATHCIESYGNNFVDGEKYYFGYDSVMQGGIVTVTAPNKFVIRGTVASANAREVFVAHEPYLLA